jgi:hypothetical protein
MSGRSRQILFGALHRPRKAQATDTSSTTFKQQLQTAIPGNFKGEQVLVINQAPKFAIANQAGDSDYQAKQTGYLPITKAQPCKRNDTTILRFSDVPGIVALAQSLGELYDGYYATFPNTTSISKEINLSNILEKAAQIISFYGVVRTFVVKIYQSRDQIVQSLGYIQNKVLTLQTDQYDMLAFFFLDDKFANIRVKAMRYEDKDIRFKYYFTGIQQTTTNFQINAQGVFTVASQMLNYGYMFVGLIDKLWNLGINKYSNNFMNILDKVDTVLTCLATLADIEMELKNAVISTKASLQNLVLFRDAISENLDNVSALSDQWDLQTTISETPIWKSSAKVLGTLVVMLVGLFWI